MTLTLFYEVAALVALATVFGIVGLALRQPLIVAFLAVGVVVGPAGLGLARSEEHITLLAELGVALLLFVVGLRLDPQLIRSVGGVAVATGLGQVIFTAVVGGALCLALGMDVVTSAYVSVALTFSSTIIIVKLLGDKREIDSLHGRIALGFLVVQDLVVVAALASLSGFSLGMGEVPASGSMRVSALALFLALAVGGWLSADRVLVRLMRSPELLTTLAIGWAALMAALGDFVGLGKELGGLVAGVALSSSTLRETLAARLSGIREFLLLFFFISLGQHLDVRAIGSQYVPGILLSLFVLVGNPLIVMVIMGLMGFRKRTGFLAGLTVAQISEFSLVLVAVGVSLGHVGPEALGLTTLVGLVTITLSTYMIYYSHALYAWLEPWLEPFERKRPWREPAGRPRPFADPPDAVIVGLGRFGLAIGRELKRRDWRILAVDFDPEALKRARSAGLRVAFGDVTDPELPDTVPLRDARWVVCTIPGWLGGPAIEDPRRTLVHLLRTCGYKGRIAVLARAPEDEAALRQAGADLVLDPFHATAERAAEILRDG